MPTPDASKSTPKTVIVPTPFELQERVDRLTDYLNDLRNKIQGRGVTPIGPPELAAEINEAQSSWANVRLGLMGARASGYEMLVHPLDASDVIERWEIRANEIATKAGQAGLLGSTWQQLPVTHRVQTVDEAMTVVEHRIESAGATLGKTLAFVALGVVGVWAAKTYFEGKAGR